jgi:AcrR family transcriptional regulator
MSEASINRPTIATILNAAEVLFVSCNYSDVSMRDIAHAAGVTTGALYHHFPSKEALYLSMLQADWAAKRQAMLEAVPPEGSCLQKLRCLTRVFLAMPPERRDLLQLVRRDRNVFKDPTRAMILKAYQETVPALVEAVLREGMSNGEVRHQDPRWLAWAYIALVETTLAAYAVATLGPLETRLEVVLDQFFYGVSPAHED